MSNIDTLVWIKNDKGCGGLADIFKRFCLGLQLTNEEYSTVLACAISFLNAYYKDKRRGRYFEFGYYIVLSYSLKKNDYRPLFDVASSFGFYPISKYLISRGLVDADQISASLIDLKLEPYSRNNLVETYHQHKTRLDVIGQKTSNVSYVAPTSFGKSSLIVELIQTLRQPRMAVIVPTKSLLVQTFRSLGSAIKGTRVLCHDEMYTEGENFVAVLTQERALRLLKNEGAYFDVVLVDEAHNLFSKDSRSILLSRLLKRNRLKNPNSKYYYFSPLVGDSSSLRLEEVQEVAESRIRFNVKEPVIYELALDGSVSTYDRFLDEFYPVAEGLSYRDYILQNSRNKNFMYILSPRKIEKFAAELSSVLPQKEDYELDKLSKTLAHNVHKDFYCVEYVKQGLLYIHGKLPDLLKEYLESKFRDISSISYLIANTVILEGVNLPIDNLCVMNTWSLQAAQLWNLIGRVNRLNDVFGEGGSLVKLRPSVHFINTKEYASSDSNMKNKIKLLRNTKFKDEVDNPTLPAFDRDKLVEKVKKETGAGAEKELNKLDAVVDRESYLTGLTGSERDLRALIYESGLDQDYINIESVFNILESKVNLFEFDESWEPSRVVDKIYQFFIKGIESHVDNLVFLRMQNEAARNFYHVFIEKMHSLSLTEHINSMVQYFNKCINEGAGKEFYIGRSYGEFEKLMLSGSFSKKTYIDLTKKNPKELVNLALVKIKVESDYVSYDLNKYVTVLYDLGLISEPEYNQFVYGSEIRAHAEYVRLGLSGSLVNRLSKDGQLGNMSVSSFGEISVNTAFRDYIETQDDFMQFEVKKYISV